MKKQDIRTSGGATGTQLPKDLDGLRSALADALRRIEALEFEVAGLRGERRPRELGKDDE